MIGYITVDCTSVLLGFLPQRKYDIFTCKNMSQSEIRKSFFVAIATCTFVETRRGSFSIVREFAKEVSSHSMFLGCFPLISYTFIGFSTIWHGFGLWNG